MISPVIGLGPILLAAAAFALPLLSLFIKSKRFYDAYAIVFASIALAISTYITCIVMDISSLVTKGSVDIRTIVLYPFGGWPPPLGIVYEIDAFGAILGLLTSVVMLLIVLYSVWYTDEFKDGGYVWYYTLLLGLEAGMLGCIYTGDAFNLFVMLEVMSIAAYGLVAFYRSRGEAVEAAIKYGLIGATATTIYFLALVFVYSAYGTLTMADIAMKSRGLIPSTVISGGIFGNILAATAVALALSIWVFMFKSAIFPLHFWLPDAHPEAPTPVSAALSGLVVNVGIYAIARFVYTLFGYGSVAELAHLRDAILLSLMVAGFASAFVGAAMMAVQRDIKRLLAYSTVSHMGFIAIGISIGLSSTPKEAALLGMTAAILHIINHSLGKALLFMSTGVMIRATGSRDIDALRGLGRYLSVAGCSTAIGTLHLLGLPPFAGFYSKLLLFLAFLAAGCPIGAALIVAAAALAIPGYAKILLTVFSAKEKENTAVRYRESGVASAALIMLVIAIVVLSIAVPLGLVDMFRKVAYNLMSFDGVLRYIDAFLATYRELFPFGAR